MDRQHFTQSSSPVHARFSITTYLHYHASSLAGRATPQADERRPGLQIQFDTDFGYVVIKIVHESTLLV